MSFTESVDAIVEADESGLLGVHASWARVRVQDICTILNGFPFSSKQFKPGGGTPLLRIRDVVRGWSETHFVGDFDPIYVVRHGELVIGMDGDFNCALWAGGDALLNQRVCKLSLNERHYDLRLLAHALPGYLSAINSRTSAITVKHLSSKTVAEIPLPLPPRQEQTRLVGAIDSYFTRLDDAVASLERVQRNLKRYRASVLKAAVEGRLLPTEAELARAEGRDYEPASVLLERILAERRRRWEEAELAKMKAEGKTPTDDRWKAKYKEPLTPKTGELPELPEGWCWATVEQLSDRVTKGTTPTSIGFDYLEFAGIRFVRVESLRDRRIDHTLPCVFIGQDAHKALLRSQLRGGDLLFSIAGTLGRVAQVHQVDTPANTNQALAIIRGATDHVLDAYLVSVLESDYGQRLVRERGRGGAMQNLSLADVSSISVPLPPTAEQQRIAIAVDRVLSLVSGTEGDVLATIVRCSHLRQSILKWAFEGRLVDQDPTDEPASRLLERIQEERESTNGNPRRSPRRPRARSPRA